MLKTKEKRKKEMSKKNPNITKDPKKEKERKKRHTELTIKLSDCIKVGGQH
jgi:hypothetical protein